MFYSDSSISFPQYLWAFSKSHTHNHVVLSARNPECRLSQSDVIVPKDFRKTELSRYCLNVSSVLRLPSSDENISLNLRRLCVCHAAATIQKYSLQQQYQSDTRTADVSLNISTLSLSLSVRISARTPRESLCFQVRLRTRGWVIILSRRLWNRFACFSGPVLWPRPCVNKWMRVEGFFFCLSVWCGGKGSSRILVGRIFTRFLPVWSVGQAGRLVTIWAHMACWVRGFEELYFDEDKVVRCNLILVYGKIDLLSIFRLWEAEGCQAVGITTHFAIYSIRAW